MAVSLNAVAARMLAAEQFITIAAANSYIVNQGSVAATSKLNNRDVSTYTCSGSCSWTCTGGCSKGAGG